MDTTTATRNLIRNGNVTTATGQVFTYKDHAALALLIYRRWGCDLASAACAWRRLFQNDCSDADFAALVMLGQG